MTASREGLLLTMDTNAIRWTPAGGPAPASCTVAAEVPFTITVNGVEIATLLASPDSLKELTTGYLYTSGFITSASEILEWWCDTKLWRAEVKLARAPDPGMMNRRLYTAGCGKCAMYTSINELNLRTPCDTPLTAEARTIVAAGEWITGCSGIFRDTGGVHAAGLFDPAHGPIFFFEDVARHNAVDKVIGRALLDSVDSRAMILVRTGRTSSEIVFKIRRAGIGITVARGAPTNQAVLLAGELGITLVGFAREDGFTVYAHPERIRM